MTAGAFPRFLRVWMRAPGAALALIVLMSLGMAGVIALFGPLYALVLSPLPLPDADRLVRIGGNIPLFNVYRDGFEHRDRLAAMFANVAAYAPVDGASAEAQFDAAGRPIQARVLAVTPEFFETLGVRPAMGRSFANQRSDYTGVVLSDRAWRTRLDRSPDVIGRSVRVGRQDRTVIAVMPETFDFPRDVDVWILAGSTAYLTSGLQFIGRLREHVPLSQAAAGLTAIGFKRGGAAGGQFGGDGPILQSLHTFLAGDRRPMVLMLWGVSILFLLLATAGCLNLLLALSVRRRPEMAVRLALGSGPWRVRGQMLAEVLGLAVVGGVIGVWLSTLATRWLHTRLLGIQQGPLPVSPTLALVGVLAVMVTILSALGPAFNATSGSLDFLRKTRASGVGGGAPGRRFLGPLEWVAGVQLAMALTLLVGTGLLLRSLTAQLNVALGIAPANVAVFEMQLPELPEYADAAVRFQEAHGLRGRPRTWALLQEMNRSLEPQIRAEVTRNALFVDNACARLIGLPDVLNAGAVFPVPFTAQANVRSHMPTTISATGSAALDGSMSATAVRGWATAEGFRALGVPIIAGRGFTENEVAGELSRRLAAVAESATGAGDGGALGSAIVNTALARRLWPNRDPIGQHFHDVYERSRTLVVVGVVGTFYWTGDSASNGPAVYYPFTGHDGRIGFVAKLRADASMEQFAARADQVTRDLVPGLPRLDVQNLQALTRRDEERTRMAFVLLACFAGLGSLVAGLGVYAATAVASSARTQEIGVRAALGATRTEIWWRTLWRSGRLVGIALPCGLFVSWLLARQMSHYMFGIVANDVVTYAGSAFFLILVSILGSLVPAFRASATDPALALRCE